MPDNDPNLVTLRPVSSQPYEEKVITPEGIAQLVFGFAWRMIPVYFLWQIAKNTSRPAKVKS